MNRRDFLITTSAFASLPRTSLSATEKVTLTAQAFEQQILPTKFAGPTAVLGFNGSVPGPELRTPKGVPISVQLHNLLDEGAAVHWHGVRLANAMDGVPDLTQPLIPPGARFDYSFTPPDAGTYWYHSHYLSHAQVAKGLMGPLIVEEDTPPDVDHEITAFLSDWKLAPDGQLTDDFENIHDMAHAGRMGNFAKAFLPDVTLKKGQRIRLRLINGAVDRVIPVILKGLSGKAVAVDGMPLPTPRDIGDPVLAPAQRIDIIADVTGPVALEMAHPNGPYPLGELAVSGEVTARDTPIPTLPPNAIPTPGEISQNLTLTMMGGAMGARHGGDNIWALNDHSGMSDAPFAQLRRGETVRISLVNDTRWPHGIHLHGHHFIEIEIDGKLGDFRDTSLVDAGETRDLLCVFDNPGKWMLHCHMLSHQVGGMKTWVEVL